jgi:OOP family OmpA-OmpF porin
MRRLVHAAIALGLLVPGLASPSAAWADLGHLQPHYQLEGNRLVPPGPVLFEAGGAKLKPGSDAALRHVAGYLADKTYISLMRVEGHVDSTASAGQALSEQRALTVARRLVTLGVDCKRLIAVGFGASKPNAPDTPAGRAANLRIDFFNAALRGKAIGGMPVDGGGKVAGDACKP